VSLAAGPERLMIVDTHVHVTLPDEKKYPKVEADRRWIFGKAALAVWPALR
jgi:hypothetical protein